MELVFHDVGPDDGQFGHLMTQGPGVVARQGVATTPTGGGLAGDSFADQVVRGQRPLPGWVPRLPAGLLAGLAGRRRWAAFAAKAVGGRRQGGVAGIGVQPDPGAGELSLELED